MLACYRSRDWDGAEKALQRAMSAADHFGLDEIFNIYRERIETFRDRRRPLPGMASMRSTRSRAKPAARIVY